VMGSQSGRSALRSGVIVSCIAVLAWLGSCGRDEAQVVLQKAAREYAAGNLVRARTLLQQLQNARPGSEQADEALNLLGVIAWEMGRAQEAYELFDRCLKRNPEHAAAAYNLAVILFRSGDLKGAVDLFSRTASLTPTDPRPLEYLAAIELKRRNLPGARRLLEKALSIDPGSPRILTALGKIDVIENRIPDALRLFREVLEDHPRYPPALYNIAVLCQDRLSDPEKARKYLQRYLQTAPGSEWRVRARKRLDRIEAAHLVARTERSESSVQTAKTAPAVTGPTAQTVTAASAETAAVARSASASADNIEALIRHAAGIARSGDTVKAATLLLKAAAEAERQGLAELQEKALRTAAEQCFDQPEAHLELGRYLLGRRRFASAAHELKQAIRLDPQSGPAYALLSKAAIGNEEYDTALVAARKAVMLMPTNREALWNLAELYDRRLGLPAQAAESYAKFLELFPRDPRCETARRRLAELGNASAPAVRREEREKTASLRKQLRKEAQKRVRRSLKLRRPRVRNRAAALQAYNRGVSYHQRSDWDRAIYYYRRALENDDRFVLAYYNLGVAYQARGDDDLAAAAYEEALKLKPDLVNAAYNLALLRWNNGGYASARALAEDIISRKPDFAPAHYLLGMIYARDARTMRQAAAHYRRFLKLKPADPAAPGVRAWLEAHHVR